MSNLHPSVQQFKEFVKRNPKIIAEVRKGSTTWQELYEEWYLLGEEDSRWDDLKEPGGSNVSAKKEDEKSEWLSQIVGVIKNMDPNQLQAHISNFSQALGAVQGLLTQFKGNSAAGSQNRSQANRPQHPFQFRKD